MEFAYGRHAVCKDIVDVGPGFLWVIESARRVVADGRVGRGCGSGRGFAGV